MERGKNQRAWESLVKRGGRASATRGQTKRAWEKSAGAREKEGEGPVPLQRWPWELICHRWEAAAFVCICYVPVVVGSERRGSLSKQHVKVI